MPATAAPPRHRGRHGRPRSTCGGSASAATARPRRPGSVPLEFEGERFSRRVRRRHPQPRDHPRGAPRRGRLRHRDPDHPARHHPGLLDRRRAHPDGRLAGAPARARRSRAPCGSGRRCGSSAPTPTAPGRPPSRSTAGCSTGSTSTAATATSAPRRRSTSCKQLPGLDARRVRGHHRGVPAVPGRDGEDRADGGRRPATLAGRDRPVLPDPAGRRRPDPAVADHPADVLRVAAGRACAGSGAASTG